MALRREVAVGVGGEALGVLAALAGVGLPAEPVHGDGQGLVGLGRDRPVGHGPGGEPLHDGRHRLDLVDRHGRQHAGRAAAAARAGWPGSSDWSSTSLRVLLEDVVALGPGGVLQLEHGLRVEEVDLALAPPLVLAADLALAMGPLGRAGRDGPCRWRSATSSASTSSPTPPIRLTVPVKYSSTTSAARPTASKIWAPVYDATVEMPILDMILMTPLQAALM